MTNKLAALFDLDGVITDTEPQYTQFWASIGASHLPDIADFAHKVKGQTLTHILPTYFPKAEEQRYIVQALEDFERQMDFPYVAGSMTFIDALRDAGIPTAVVTSSNKEKMACLYANIPDFASHFTAVFTAEAVAHSKPAPDCYLNAAKQLGIAPQRCAIFEDSINGLKAAREAGGHVVGLATTNSADTIRPLADLVIADFTSFSVDQMAKLIEGEQD